MPTADLISLPKNHPQSAEEAHEKNRGDSRSNYKLILYLLASRCHQVVTRTLGFWIQTQMLLHLLKAVSALMQIALSTS